MSVIKVNKIEHTGTTAGGVEVDSSGHVQVDGVQMPTAGPLSNRNLVINGGMTVWQRGTASAAVTNAFLADRFVTIEATDGAITHEQSTDAPDGFAYSLKLSVTTADTSLAAGQYAQLDHRIEAQNCQHLKYGSSAAETITLSFWVKSSKTGTYCIRLGKIDSTGYAYVKEYTISSANTWEKKTITIEPDNSIKASAGAIANDNGEGLRITWPLAMGSTYSAATDGVWSSNLNDHATANAVNWLDGTSNNLYLTGVQLEVGEKATAFSHLSYHDELLKCKRYFVRKNAPGYQRGFNGLGMGTVYTTSTAFAYLNHDVEMRSAPTIDHKTIGDFQTVSGSGSGGAITDITISTSTEESTILNIASSAAFHTERMFILWSNTNGAYIDLNAEL